MPTSGAAHEWAPRILGRPLTVSYANSAGNLVVADLATNVRPEFLEHRLGRVIRHQQFPAPAGPVARGRGRSFDSGLLERHTSQSLRSRRRTGASREIFRRWSAGARQQEAGGPRLNEQGDADHAKPGPKPRISDHPSLY
jgi:hypothetical protein